jgi:hypothetical protein
VTVGDFLIAGGVLLLVLAIYDLLHPKLPLRRPGSSASEPSRPSARGDRVHLSMVRSALRDGSPPRREANRGRTGVSRLFDLA